MAEKNMKARIVHKHDTETNWLKATNFIPRKGEIIVYDIDDIHNYERMKIGDGETFVVNLPFVYDNVTDMINSLVGDESVSEQISNSVSTRKEKDLIVTYQDTNNYYISHTIDQINEAVNNGRTVYFKKDAELLSLLEITKNYATFYICYVNMNGKLQQKIIAVSGNTIMLEQDDTYDYVSQTTLTNTLKNYSTKTDLNGYYTKTETENYVNNTLESIALEAIDVICDGTVNS